MPKDNRALLLDADFPKQTTFYRISCALRAEGLTLASAHKTADK